MCGIAGIAHLGTAEPVDRTLLERMTKRLAHRGPDDDGILVDGPVGLGSRRLAIVDLSPSGHQPMANEDESVWIVFNGEIYNHLALRRGLEARGHRYRGRSDTETILHLYEERGEACVTELEGEFAFALWDGRRRKTLLVRDRLGVKPLYYTEHDGALIFASEIKAILEHPGIPRRVDLEALYHYLTFFTTPAPSTLFAGIRKLPPGHLLTWDGRSRPVLRPYWQLAEAATRVARTESEWVEAVREHVRLAVDARMMSDVPVGVFLSGGIDSSTALALMAQGSGPPVETFSVGFRDNPAYNELDYARLAAKRFGANHHEVLIGHEDMIEYLPSLIYHQDEPLADPVCVPLYYLSRLAREHGVKVVQVGEGADELFAGYPGYLVALALYDRAWRRFTALPSPLRALTYRGLAPAFRAVGRVKELDHLHRAALGEEMFWGSFIAFRELEKRALLRGPLGNGALTSHDVVRAHLEPLDRAWPDADILQRMVYIDLTLRLPELILTRIDKITMSTSVEARVPFLDHRLVELTLGIPRNLRIRTGPKHLLKKALRDLLPAEIIDRPKQGFIAPIREWFRGPAAALVATRLERSALWDLGCFDVAHVRALVRRHREGRRDLSTRLWCLLNLALWYDDWIDHSPGSGR
jgi:asparagine synthase (glutamine-hydrolysing)